MALEDGNSRSAKDLSRITGRTPGALHAPLNRLCRDGLIRSSSEPRNETRRGRPAQLFTIHPDASSGPDMLNANVLKLRLEADAAALRMLNRCAQTNARENLVRSRASEPTLINECSIEYGFLNQRELNQVERKMEEIRLILRRQRSSATDSRNRVRVGLVLIEEQN